MKIDLVVFILIYLVSIFTLILMYNKKIDKLKSAAFTTKENKILKELLALNLKKKDALSLEESANLIIQVLKKYYKMDYCSVLIFKEALNTLNTISTDADERYIKDMDNYCNRLYTSSDNPKIEYSDSFLQYRSAAERSIKYACFIPLKNYHLANLEKGRSVIGAILIENKNNYVEQDTELDFSEIIINNLTLVFQNFIYQHKITKMAMIDKLTGIYNRHYFHIHLNKEIEKGEPFSLAMFDIDYFKNFNDTYGHEVGDTILFEIAQFIKKNIRKCDELYRWGGEEFIIFLSNCTGKEAYRILDKIRSDLSNVMFQNEEGRVINETEITGSFGIASFPKNAKSIEELRECADKAMYYSKFNGRNRVTLYDDISK